jgi:hypothetical protein
MKYLSRKNIAKYVYNQLTGNFAGFIVGVSASGLVSRFFETRSIRNLWGITSKKTVISKENFAALEWIISIVIGFIVFEIMTRVVKERLDRKVPALRIKLYRWIHRNRLKQRSREALLTLQNRRLGIFSGFTMTLRKTLLRNSRQ